MTLAVGTSLPRRGQPQALRCGSSGSSHATSAMVGGSWRGAPARYVIVRTAHRDDVEEAERRRRAENHVDAEVAVGGRASSTTIPRTSSRHASPLSFKTPKKLPNLSCSPRGSASCFNIRGIDDPCLDGSLDLKIYEYMVELVRSGTTQERAAEVISQWSGGGGVEAVDLGRMRSHFLKTTLEDVVRQYAAQVMMPFLATCLSYWSLGLLPDTDEAVRGPLVAANLLLLVGFASRSLRAAGRFFGVVQVAVQFSAQAELVLLAMRDLAEGHGPLIRAVLGRPPAAAPTTSMTRALEDSNPDRATASGAATSASTAAVAAAITSAAVAAQRHTSRQRVLQASTAVMRHVKRQAAAASATAAAATATATATAASGFLQFSLPPPTPPPPPQSSARSSLVPSKEQSQTPSTSSSREPATTPPSPPAVHPIPIRGPLSSLDSYLVLREAATLAGGLDAAAELGISSEEAVAAAAMYARYGDSSQGGRFGDYELQRLLQDVDRSPQPPPTPEERCLVLLLHSREAQEAGSGSRVGTGGRGREKGWLTFAEWAAWWAATPSLGLPSADS